MAQVSSRRESETDAEKYEGRPDPKRRRLDDQPPENGTVVSWPVEDLSAYRPGELQPSEEVENMGKERTAFRVFNNVSILVRCENVFIDLVRRRSRTRASSKRAQSTPR